MKENLLYSLLETAEASAQLPPGRVFALDGQTFISVVIQIINIAILFFILYKLLYHPVKDILIKRKERIAEQLSVLETDQKRAQDLIAEYEAKLADVHIERHRLIEEAREEAEEVKIRIIDRAEKEAQKIKENTIKALETERKLLQRNAKDYVVELSTLMAEKTLKDSVTQDAQDGQFEESLKKLEAASWQD
jgi:F-type H+-transporting ATPase subunit b